MVVVPCVRAARGGCNYVCGVGSVSSGIDREERPIHRRTVANVLQLRHSVLRLRARRHHRQFLRFCVPGAVDSPRRVRASLPRTATSFVTS